MYCIIPFFKHIFASTSSIYFFNFIKTNLKMTQNNQNTNAFLIHISSFTGYLFPFGSIITPLILWQTQKDRSSFLDAHGKEAVNFNISFGLYIFILGTGFFSFFFGNFFNLLNGINVDFNLNQDYSFSNLFGFFGIASLALIFSAIKIALIIIASMKANNGEQYKYPFTIKFIK